ncbi:hypothetical protein HMI56_004041 [Coelomomyces lativittatus]|nr:hypothetical protein HMI56_004041 [Coelomomyces lativittatus]
MTRALLLECTAAIHSIQENHETLINKALLNPSQWSSLTIQDFKETFRSIQKLSNETFLTKTMDSIAWLQNLSPTLLKQALSGLQTTSTHVLTSLETLKTSLSKIQPQEIVVVHPPKRGRKSKSIKKTSPPPLSQRTLRSRQKKK